VPAAAVIPALIVYTKIVAVKKLVVSNWLLSVVSVTAALAQSDFKVYLVVSRMFFRMFKSYRVSCFPRWVAHSVRCAGRRCSC